MKRGVFEKKVGKYIGKGILVFCSNFNVFYTNV